MANITTETIDGTKHYTTVHRGTEYTLSANGIDGWFVATRRLSLSGRGLGNGKVFDTLAAVAAGCKAFGDEAALINMVFGVEVAQAIAA